MNQQVLNNSSLQSLLLKIKQATSIEKKIDFINKLCTNKDPLFINDFLEKNSLEYIGQWIKELKEKIEKVDKLNEQEEELLIQIIKYLSNINLTISDLKTTKIGKYINKLSKTLKYNLKVKKACEIIVSDWRRMLENENEKDLNRNNFISKKQKRSNSNDSSESNKKCKNDNSNKFNLINNNHCNKSIKPYINIILFSLILKLNFFIFNHYFIMTYQFKNSLNQ